MFNRSAQKKLTVVVWGTNTMGALVVLAIVVSAFQLHGWLGRECASSEARRRDDMAVLARAEQIRADRETAALQLSSLNDQLADIKSRLPPSPKEAEFLSQVSSLAEHSGVRLKNFRPGQTTNAGSVNACEVQLSLVGSFASICKLLNGLAGVPRFLSVARLTLAGPQTAGDACMADLTINLCFAATSDKH
jgi:Tfp pilus assembly protein PilO